MHPLLASLPILALIAAMTLRIPRARLPLPAHVALPAAAALALALQALAGTSAGAGVLAARIIEGALTALMPLAIVFGAIILFRTLERSGAMRAITSRLERSVPDPVLRVLLIAWAFSYLVEGLSGFGAPAALAAPLLVGLGFPPVRAAAACLVMNTTPVVFGAVGTPIWFGLGEIGLDAAEHRAIGFTAAIVQAIAAPVIVALALRLLFPWNELKRRAVAIVAIPLLTVAAAAITARFSVEFPSIVGGTCALAAASLAGRFGRSEPSRSPPTEAAPEMPIWRAALPLVATIALLAVTRLEPLGLRRLLNAESPALEVDLGSLGEFSVSAALVVSLRDILGAGIAWTMPLLYVPFIIPFIVVALASGPLLGLSRRDHAGVWGGALRRLALPAVALVGALVFVKLMMHGGESAPLIAVGRALAAAVAAIHGPLWIGAAPIVGALGSFFSGSATVSNLTFAPLQLEIADRLALDQTRVLALQSVGAALGNMICIHNIVAVAAVLGLGARSAATTAANARAAPVSEDPVAEILRLTATPLAAALALAALAAAALP